MDKPEIRRIYRQFTPEERERWLRARREVEQELPEILARHKLHMEAAAEPTVSGLVRRAVHKCGLTIPRVAQAAGISIEDLDYFLAGELNLRSDVLDRLARAAGLDFPKPTDDRTDNPTRPEAGKAPAVPIIAEAPPSAPATPTGS
jgi:hypothetical protein